MEFLLFLFAIEPPLVARLENGAKMAVMDCDIRRMCGNHEARPW